MRQNFSELVTFYLCGLCALTPVHAALIVFVLIPALSRRCGRVLLFTVCSHQPFPISPSGKSQLFVQVPSVIEFAAEIAAWKISFSLPQGVCGVCVCVSVRATQSSSPPSELIYSVLHFPVYMLSSLGHCTNRLKCFSWSHLSCFQPALLCYLHHFYFAQYLFCIYFAISWHSGLTTKLYGNLPCNL